MNIGRVVNRYIKSPAFRVFALFMFLQFLDLLSTYLILGTGYGVELNPVARWLCSRGFAWLVIGKIVASASCIPVALWYRNVLKWINILYCAIVVNNLLWLLYIWTYN